MEFEGILLQAGKTATGIEVPPAVLDELGGGKRPKVRVTLGSHSWRLTLGSMGGKTMIPVSAEHRAAANVAGGDTLTVGIVLDATADALDVPADLATALDGEPDARSFFDGLTPSQKKEWVRWVTEAKKAETRSARVEKAATLLQAGQKAH